MRRGRILILTGIYREYPFKRIDLMACRCVGSFVEWNFPLQPLSAKQAVVLARSIRDIRDRWCALACSLLGTR